LGPYALTKSDNVWRAYLRGLLRSIYGPADKHDDGGSAMLVVRHAMETKLVQARGTMQVLRSIESCLPVQSSCPTKEALCFWGKCKSGAEVKVEVAVLGSGE
jgi:hypothetical protein